MITQIKPTSPAAAAGLQAGDLITHINLQGVHSASRANQILSSLKDRIVILNIERRGELYILELKSK